MDNNDNDNVRRWAVTQDDDGCWHATTGGGWSRAETRSALDSLYAEGEEVCYGGLYPTDCHTDPKAKAKARRA